MAFSLLMFFVLTPLFTFLITKASLMGQQIFLNSISNRAIYTTGVSWGAFLVPSLFLSLIIFGVVINVFIEIVGRVIVPNRDEWKVYMNNFNLASSGGMNMDQKKIFILMSVVIVPLSLLAFALAVRNYAQFGNDDVFYNGYFDVRGKHYPYSDVSKIYSVDSSSNGLYYSIVFNNGFNLKTLNLNVSQTPLELEIINLVSQKSGLPIEQKPQ